MRTSLESGSHHTAAEAPVPRGEPARVFTVPPGRPFLEAIAHAILKGDLPASGGALPYPLDLPGVTLLLPTRRAVRAVQEAFLKAGGGRAMTLPRIRPIAEGEEDLNLLSGLAGEDAFGPVARFSRPFLRRQEAGIVKVGFGER